MLGTDDRFNILKIMRSSPVALLSVVLITFLLSLPAQGKSVIINYADIDNHIYF